MTPAQTLQILTIMTPDLRARLQISRHTDDVRMPVTYLSGLPQMLATHSALAYIIADFVGAQSGRRCPSVELRCITWLGKPVDVILTL